MEEGPDVEAIPGRGSNSVHVNPSYNSSDVKPPLDDISEISINANSDDNIKGIYVK